MDGNKTALTHRITACACAYLDMRGFKPVETEVRVTDGWVADIASFVYPSMTELRDLKIIANKYCEDPTANEIEYRYGYPLTAIVEVKAFLQDFKKDLSTKFSGQKFPAHLCYLAYPKGMIDRKDIPRGWIGLETNEEGNRVIKAVRQKPFTELHPQCQGDTTDLIACVAIRRDNRTRYAAQRAFIKAHNARQKEREANFKATSLIRDLTEWLEGNGFYGDKPFEKFLEYHGVKNIPHYVRKKVEYFESLKERIANEQNVQKGS